MPTFAEILGLAAKNATPSTGAGYLAQPERRVVIQATPPAPMPIGRVYHMQAQPPGPPAPPAEPPTIMIPGVGPVVPPQHQMTAAEQALMPRQVIVDVPKKKKKK